MSALKIVFIAGDRTIVLYGQGMKQMWQVESHVLERLGEEERLRLDTAQFRKYWIDDEGDRVEIMNDVDYDFFLKRAGSCNRTPKIYFEARYPEKKQQQENQASSSSSPSRGSQNLSVHSTVSCDMCNVVPVVGFRYKCLQCHNFDLCMKCEGEMKHPDHLMLRIPTSDSPILESMCPIPNIFGNKRRQRKYAAEAAAAAAAAANPNTGRYHEAPQAEGKSRHHRHHRRHCGNGSGGAGIWANLYDMMQDLAEGGAVPQDSGATEAPQQQETSAPSTAKAPTSAAESAAAAAAAATTAAAAAAVNSQSKETNTSPDRSSTSSAGEQNPPRYSASAPPSFENLQNFIDPTFMKAGIQILNNFSEMFGKILEPVPTADTSRGTSTPSSVVIDLTSENRASATPPSTATETPNVANVATGSTTPSAAGSGVVTPMETEISPPAPVTPPEALPRSRNSQSEENDWTMIDNNIATSTTSDAAAAAAAVAASTPMDYAKLSQQLQSHIENERKQQEQQVEATAATQATLAAIPAPTIPMIPSPVPVAAPVAPVITPLIAPVPPVAAAAAPAPTTPDTTERRAVAVFHSDARINNAVHAMMAMGFSNEGAVLTQLLESVDGNIPVALDLMSAAQRN